MSSARVHFRAGPGVGLAGLIGVLFLGLKLGGVMPVAGWSWLWVLAPFWIGLALVCCFFFFALLLFVAAAIFSRR